MLGVFRFVHFVCCICAGACLSTNHQKDPFLSASQFAPSAMPVSDSVVSFLEEIENAPPKRYSENQFFEIREALDKKSQKVRIVTYNRPLSKIYVYI